MAEDIAALGLEVDSTSLKTGTENLKNFEAVARRTGETAQQVQARFKTLSDAQKAQSDSAAKASKSSDDMAKGHAKVTATGMTQLQMWRALSHEISAIDPALGSVIRNFGITSTALGHLPAALSAAAIGVAALVVAFKGLLVLEQQAAAIGTIGQFSGLGSQQLQGITTAANFVGVATKDFQATMVKFNQEVDKSKDGLGSLAALFRTNNVSATDTADAFFKVADLVKNARSEADKFSIAQQAGLPATTEMIRLLQQGGSAIRQTMEEARKLTDDQVREAQVIEDRWNKMWTNFTQFAKTAILDVVSFMNINIVDLFTMGFQNALAKAKAATQGNATFAERFAPFAVSGISVKTSQPTFNPEEAKAQLEMERARIAVLGQTATVEQQVIAKQKELDIAGINGTGVTDKQRQAIIALTRSMADGTFQMQAQVDALTTEAATIGMSAGKAAEYTAFQERVNDAKRRGVKESPETIAAWEKESKAIGEATQKLNDLRFASDAVGNFINTFVQDMTSGKKAAEAFASAVQGLGNTITSAASKKLGESIIGSIGGSSIGQALGSFGGPIGGLVFGGALSLLGNLFGNKNKEAQQQANEQANQKAVEGFLAAQDALKGVVESFKQLTEIAKGPLTTAIKGAQNQFEGLVSAAEAQKRAAQALGASANVTPGQSAAANAAFAEANQEIDRARRALEEYNRRTIEAGEAALRGSDALSEIGQAMADLQKQADDLREAMQNAGISAEDAARRVQDDLNAALQRLADRTAVDLTRQINQLSGRGFLNDLNDLAQTLADASRLNISTDLTQNFLVARAQDIINASQLTGQAFEDLLNQFPQLRGAVQQFGDTAAAVTARASTLSDRLFAALNDTSTLEGQLAAFDREAQVQREEEARLGGANMVLLEETLQAERLNVITTYNARIVADQIASAQKIQDAVNAAALNIAKYLNTLKTGTDSALSPSARLAAAQSTFNSQLALAQSGNIDANNSITQYAEDLRNAAQAFFGSASGYQTVLTQIQNSLAALPVLAQATDPVVTALLNNVVPAVNNTTSAVGGTTSAVGGTTNAVNTNTSTTSSGDSATQSILNTVNASTQAVNSQVQATNSLATAANSLASTANSLLTSSNSTLTAINNVSNAINTNTAFLASIENLLRDISAFLNDIQSKTQLISGYTSHMYAPGGSLNFQLASGGWVGAGGGGSRMFKLAGGGPVGTDTVPAMLTPGEFVVNRMSAQANRGLLTAINSGGGGSDVAGLLRIIADKIDQNTMATVGQTVSINRETRLANRKRSAA